MHSYWFAILLIIVLLIIFIYIIYFYVIHPPIHLILLNTLKVETVGVNEAQRMILEQISKGELGIPFVVKHCLISKYARFWKWICFNNINKWFVDAGSKLMVTKHNIVGHYTEDQINIKIHNAEAVGEVKPELGTGHVLLPHYQYTACWDENCARYRESENSNKSTFFLSPNEKYYLRSLNLKGHELFTEYALPWFLPQQILMAFNFYVSGRGMITNMHYDSLSGFMLQLKGRKRILLYPPSAKEKMQMFPEDGPLRRRSKFNKKWTRELVEQIDLVGQGYEIILKPNHWLYIPKRWLHYVESLDTETWSIIGGLCQKKNVSMSDDDAKTEKI